MGTALTCASHNLLFATFTAHVLVVLVQVQAGKEKELGNKAFADKDYESAIKHFTTCIELNPK